MRDPQHPVWSTQKTLATLFGVVVVGALLGLAIQNNEEKLIPIVDKDDSHTPRNSERLQSIREQSDLLKSNIDSYQETRQSPQEYQSVPIEKTSVDQITGEILRESNRSQEEMQRHSKERAEILDTIQENGERRRAELEAIYYNQKTKQAENERQLQYYNELRRASERRGN